MLENNRKFPDDVKTSIQTAKFLELSFAWKTPGEVILQELGHFCALFDEFTSSKVGFTAHNFRSSQKYSLLK